MKLNKIFIALCIFVLMISCEKKKDHINRSSKNNDTIDFQDDTNKLSDSHRVKEIIITYDIGTEEEYETKSIFKYSGNKLVSIVDHLRNGENWYEYKKTEIKYGDGDITQTWSELVDDKWEVYSKSLYHENNGLFVDEYNYNYDNGWVINYIWEYKYSDSKLIEWKSQFNIDGDIITDGRGDYNYTGNNLTLYDEYYYSESIWIHYYSEEFKYTNDILTEVISYYGQDDMVEYLKQELLYEDSILSEINWYLWDEELIHWNIDEKNLFEFNEEKNLSKIYAEKYSEDASVDETLLSYEKGSGNAKFFWYYPEDLVYGQPTLKSLDKKTKYIPVHKRIRDNNVIF